MIGAGAAGLSITNVAARLGLRVTLIERARMGGDCLNAGCVPSKALLAAGHAAQAARRAGQYGVRLPEPEVDWAAVRAHVRRAIEAIAPADSEERYRALGAAVLRADAALTGPDTVEAGGQRITARRIVLATGSRPVVPDIPGLDRVPHLTNETLFDLAERPEHLLILGGGPIGFEMAQAHAGLGCRVTVVEAGRVLAREDAELAGLLRDALAAEGIDIREDCEVASVEPGPVLVLRGGERIAGTHLLVAAGRRPILDGLGLDAAGVRAGRRGIATDAGLRSLTNRRVFAAGDAADPAGLGPRYFTHVGSYHAGVLVRRMLFRLPAPVGAPRGVPRLRPAVLFVVAAVAVTFSGALVSRPTAAEDGTRSIAAVQGNTPEAGLEFNAERRAVLDNHAGATEGLAAQVAAGEARADSRAAETYDDGLCG